MDVDMQGIGWTTRSSTYESRSHTLDSHMGMERRSCPCDPRAPCTVDTPAPRTPSKRCVVQMGNVELERKNCVKVVGVANGGKVCC